MERGLVLYTHRLAGSPTQSGLRYMDLKEFLYIITWAIGNVGMGTIRWIRSHGNFLGCMFHPFTLCDVKGPRRPWLFWFGGGFWLVFVAHHLRGPFVLCQLSFHWCCNRQITPLLSWRAREGKSKIAFCSVLVGYARSILHEKNFGCQ